MTQDDGRERTAPHNERVGDEISSGTPAVAISLRASARADAVRASYEASGDERPDRGVDVWVTYAGVQMMAGDEGYAVTGQEVEPIAARLMAEVKLLESGDAYWPDTVDAIELAAREIKRLRAALAESCAEERSQIWEAGPGGGCARALAAEAIIDRIDRRMGVGWTRKLADALTPNAELTGERAEGLRKSGRTPG